MDIASHDAMKINNGDIKHRALVYIYDAEHDFFFQMMLLMIFFIFFV